MKVVFKNPDQVRQIARNIISHLPEDGVELDDLAQRVARRLAGKSNRCTRRFEISNASMRVLETAVRQLISGLKVFSTPAEGGKIFFYPVPVRPGQRPLSASVKRAVRKTPTLVPESADADADADADALDPGPGSIVDISDKFRPIIREIDVSSPDPAQLVALAAAAGVLSWEHSGKVFLELDPETAGYVISCILANKFAIKV